MSWNSSAYPGDNSYYYPGFSNSSYPSPTPSSTPSYFSSSYSDVQPLFIIFPVIFGIFFIVSVSTAVVRNCSSSNSANYEWNATRPPPARIISTPAVNDSHLNYVIDVRSQGSYVQMASTPHYHHPTVPVAVAVPTAPDASNNDDSLPTVTPQPGYYGALESADQIAMPIIAIGSLPAAQDPVISATRIPFEALTLHVLISKSEFGRVYKGMYRNEAVVIRKLLPETEKNVQHVTAFLREIKLMATLVHPHIVRYIGVSWEALSEVCAVTEFMEGGDLRAALTHFQAINRPHGFDFQKTTIALHVARALSYLHSMQPEVLHRGLKSRNIILDKTQTLAKVTDIGVSRDRVDSNMSTAVGTLLWMAPEVMAGEKHDDKADIFSLGVILSELDTHAMPYAGVKAQLVSESGRPLPDTALLQRIMTGRVIVSFSDRLQHEVQALATSCLALDPSKRPNASHVLHQLEQIQRLM